MHHRQDVGAPTRARRWLAITAAATATSVSLVASPDAALAIPPSEPMPIVVTTHMDVVDGEAGDDGFTSLREAVAQANLNGGPDTITFDPDILPGTFTLGSAITVHGDLTVAGTSAADIVVDGQGNTGLFVVTSGPLTLERVTLTGGNAEAAGGAVSASVSDVHLVDAVLRDNHAAGPGGAVAVASGTLSVVGSTIEANSTDDTGGAIAVSQGSLNVSDSSVADNVASGAGGGIFTDRTTVVLQTGTVVRDNMATTASGGGVHIRSGRYVSLHDVTVVGNTAGTGGGGIDLDSQVGNVTIWRSAIGDNEALGGDGGGIRVDLYAESSFVPGAFMLDRSTVAENTATLLGGGIAVLRADDDSFDVQSSTIAGNEARFGGGLGLESSVMAARLHFDTIAGNTASEVGGNIVVQSYGEHLAHALLDHTIVADGIAPVGADVGGTGYLTTKWSLLSNPAADDVVESISNHTLIGDPDLGELADHTVPLPRPIGAASAARDAGDPELTADFAPNTDQAGNVRIAGSAIDIGAYEFQGEVTSTLTVAVTGHGTVTSSPAGINCGSTCNAEFADESSVHLTPVAATGYRFDGWTGSCGVSALSFRKAIESSDSGSGGHGHGDNPDTCTLHMHRDHDVTATFKPVTPSAPALPPIVITPPTTAPPTTTPPTTAPPAAEGPTVTPPGQPVEVPTRECPTDGRFGDTAGNRHERNIDCAAWWGITVGQDETTYGPTFGVTRGQVASFLVRLLGIAGEPLGTGDDVFPDDQGTTHEAATNALAGAGVAFGRSDATFGADVVVTRGQFLSLLVQAYEHRTGTTLPTGGDHFGDDDGNVHETSIEKAYALGLTVGRADGVFAPDAPLTRDEAATFLMRVLDLLGGEGLVIAR